MILQLVEFFPLLLAATTVTALLPGVIRARWWIGIPSCIAALAAAAFLFDLVTSDPSAAVVLGITTLAVTATVRAAFPRWSWPAAQLLAVLTLASLAYLAYAALQTFATGLPPLAMAASTVLLLLEIAALTLSVSYTFEVVDVLGRREPPFVPPPLTRTPWVALQVPTYSEPVEIVQRTLESLAAIDYPNLLVQVVDNNTKDEAVWRPLEQLCARLGPRFQFLHLDPWPGFKAGACNEATRRLPAEIEILGIVDADYMVRPDFLQRMIGHFDDPAVAFAQSSQNYRDWENDPYLRGLFYSFRYFFDLTMPARHHRNAIIFCGTMGLIRRSALEHIGGWSETCITEDAEASLRLLGAGYRSAYDPTAYGAGLMPLTFDGLKKQRYRWALGGLQILRQHWRELVPLARHRLQLTRAQRVHYLLGSMQWFGELLTAVFTVLLLLTAATTALHHSLPLRQLTGAVLAIPIALATTGVLRALWAMRVTTGCRAGDAVRALRIWFALSWVVTLACLRGLVSGEAEFLRTPKRKEGASLLQTLRASRMETALAALAVAGAAAIIISTPALTTLVLGALLLFQAALYSCAIWATVAADHVELTADRRRQLLSPQNTGDRPLWRRPAVAVPAALVAAAGAAAASVLVLTSPSAGTPFQKGQRDLPSIGSVVSVVRSATTPTTGASPSPSPSGSPQSSPSPSTSASPRSTPSPSVSATTTGSSSSATSSSASPSSAVPVPPTPTP